MPTVPEFTPGMLWTTIYGLLALCLLFMIGYKVYDAIHTINERRREKREASKPDFAEAVSQKVIEKLEPRFFPRYPLCLQRWHHRSQRPDITHPRQRSDCT